MRIRLLPLIFVWTLLAAGCESPAARTSPAEGPRIVEAGCATCIFGMPDVEGCKLAVKIDGKPYLVEGSDLDDHGDAHAPDGMCNTARQARIEGQIREGRFVARSVQLLP